MKVVRFIKGIYEAGMSVPVKEADGSITVVRKGYSHETLKQYTKACVDLYHKQMSENRGILTMVHPRGETLKTYERSLKKLCSVARSTEDYVDPGIGSIQDGYNSEQMAQVADYYMKRGKRPVMGLGIEWFFC